MWLDDIIIVYYYFLLNNVLYVLFFGFACVWWPGMAVNVSVQNDISGSLPDIILLTQGYYVPLLGNPFKCHEKVVFIAYQV